MGVSHSLNSEQVEAVIQQVDATADAIQGIEAKCSTTGEYIQKGHHQQEALSKKAEAFSKVVDDFADSLNVKTEGVLHTLINILEDFADSVESLEVAIAGVGLKDAPRDMQKDFIVLIVPALVLVILVAGSNCIFGFMLAYDTRMKTLETGEGKNHFDNLLLFAIFHMLLLGFAFLYLLGEVLRRVCSCRSTNQADSPMAMMDGEDSGPGMPVHAPQAPGSSVSASWTQLLRSDQGVDSRGKPISSRLRTLQMSATNLTVRSQTGLAAAAQQRRQQGRRPGSLASTAFPFLPTVFGLAVPPAAADDEDRPSAPRESGEEHMNV